MARRTALAVLTLCSLVCLACQFMNHRICDWLFGIAAMLFIPALMALGAARRGRLGYFALPVLLFGLYLILCFTAMMLLSAGTAVRSGLPPAAILMLGGLWLAPLPVVALGYAWHFGRSGSRRPAIEADER